MDRKTATNPEIQSNYVKLTRAILNDVSKLIDIEFYFDKIDVDLTFHQYFYGDVIPKRYKLDTKYLLRVSVPYKIKVGNEYLEQEYRLFYYNKDLYFGRVRGRISPCRKYNQLMTKDKIVGYVATDIGVIHGIYTSKALDKFFDKNSIQQDRKMRRECKDVKLLTKQFERI